MSLFTVEGAQHLGSPHLVDAICTPRTFELPLESQKQWMYQRLQGEERFRAAGRCRDGLRQLAGGGERVICLPVERGA